MLRSRGRRLKQKRNGESQGLFLILAAAAIACAIAAYSSLNSIFHY